jgi:lysophospholipase L1-like esterase
VHDLIRAKGIYDPSDPSASLALYRRNLEQILLRIQSQTEARVAVLSIPPLGEDLQSPANIILRRYNDSVREICARRQIAYLPVYEAMSEIIQQSQRTRAVRSSDQPGNLSAKVALRHYILRQNWDQISQIDGFSVHTDGVHLNSHGGNILAGLLEQWMTTQLVPVVNPSVARPAPSR